MYALFISIFFFIQNSFIFLVGWGGGVGVLLVFCGTRSAHLFEVSRNALFSCSATSGECPSFYLCYFYLLFKNHVSTTIAFTSGYNFSGYLFLWPSY
jgi:hypothetical protein